MTYDTCHDCACAEGERHLPGCDMERCPLCGGQAISCDCPEAEQQAATPVPYILYPNLCVYCGKRWPDMFRVPDEEWAKYIDMNHRHAMICRPCYDLIVEMIDKGAST